MRSAPATAASADVRAWHRMLLVVVAAVAAVQWSWALAGGRAGALFLALTTSLASLLFLRSECRRPLARLRWDGACWSMQLNEPGRCIERAGELTVLADVGAWILVLFRPQAGRTKERAAPLVLSRRCAPANWHAVRCALYSPRPSPTTRAQDPA